jgi:hypothetical protein
MIGIYEVFDTNGASHSLIGLPGKRALVEACDGLSLVIRLFQIQLSLRKAIELVQELIYGFHHLKPFICRSRIRLSRIRIDCEQLNQRPAAPIPRLKDRGY